MKDTRNIFHISLTVIATLLLIMFNDMRSNISVMSKSVVTLNKSISVIATNDGWQTKKIDKLESRVEILEQ